MGDFQLTSLVEEHVTKGKEIKTFCSLLSIWTSHPLCKQTSLRSPKLLKELLNGGKATSSSSEPQVCFLRVGHLTVLTYQACHGAVRSALLTAWWCCSSQHLLTQISRLMMMVSLPMQEMELFPANRLKGTHSQIAWRLARCQISECTGQNNPLHDLVKVHTLSWLSLYIKY